MDLSLTSEPPLLAPLAPRLRLTPGLDLGVLDTT